MTAKTNYITIKEPCYVGWENMNVSEMGKFCSFCKKHVHDFSSASIDEIKKAYFENNGILCGHVPAKLIRDQYVQRETQKGYFNHLKTFCLAAIFCFGTNLFTIDHAKANVLQNLKKLFFIYFSDVNKDSISITGQVKNKDTHEAIPFVNILVTYNDSIIYRTNTNAEGAYEIKLQKNKFSKIDIKAMSVGYGTHIMKGISVMANKKVIVDIDLEQEIMLDGMMIMQKEPIKIEDLPPGKTIKAEEFKHMPK